MLLSPWTNFGKGVITAAPSPAISGVSFSMSTADAAEFPDPDTDGAFDVVVFSAAGQPSSANAEIVRVTASAAPSGGNVAFTIVRAQQGSTAREILLTDRVYLGVTKEVLDTLSAALAIAGDLDNPVTSTIDDDTMATASATTLATSESIKDYAGHSVSTASSATPTPTGDRKRNELYVTALAAAAELQAPSGTPINGNILIVRIKDNGTARALTYNAIYSGVIDALRSTTVISKVLYMGFVYNSTTSKWEMVAIAEEA